MTTKGTDNRFRSLTVVGEAGTPATPASGDFKLYVADDGTFYIMDDTGTPTAVGGGGFSDPMTTRGDIIIRNASNVTARLGRGSAGKVLTSDGTDISWQTPTGGAPSTAEYVTTAADGGLSAERVIDLGAYSLLTRRAAAVTEDDHFDASSLDAKWLAYTGNNPTVVTTDKLGWAHLTAGGYKLQAVTSGDYTIETEVMVGGVTAAAYQNSGLILTNGTTQSSATDIRLGIGHENSLTKFRFVYEKFVNGAFSSTIGEWNSGSSPPQSSPAPAERIFIRCRRTGTTNFTMDFSFNGWTWHQLFTSGSIGFTPTHYGFGGDNDSYFNYFLRY